MNKVCNCCVFKVDPDLAHRIVENTRRYTNIFAEAVDEMLSNYKEREVSVELFHSTSQIL